MIKLIDRWDDISSEGREKYMTIAINDKELVDVKVKEDEFMYIMETDNGGEVYEIGDSEVGTRDCTKEETEAVLEFAEEQIQVERQLDSLFYKEDRR